MKLSIEKTSKNTKPNQCLVVAVAQKGTQPGKKSSPDVDFTGLESELKNLIKNSVQEKEITGSKKECTFFRNLSVGKYTHLMVVGLGPKASVDGETYRQAAAAAYQALFGARAKSADIDLSSWLRATRKNETGLQAMVEGIRLAGYEFDEHKSKGDQHDNARSIKHIRFLMGSSQGASLSRAFKKGETLSECVNFARHLGDLPGNLLNPDILAKMTQKEARGSGLKVTVWDKARIKKEKMGGLYGVALGSGHHPRFIIMEYKGAASSRKPVCLVGKGLTFDSGGISIKPSAAMDEMKYDMCGGSTVIGAMLAVAKLKLKTNVIGLVPASENMPGPYANKPGDILKARNGKTVEVLNTDAEGRLILMDALSYASELKPKAILDAATLTGAMVVALGNSHTGFFTRNNSLTKSIQSAADATGEQVWPMPITDQHVGDMKGLHADLSNISSFRGAGSSTAAAFLEQFVAEGIPWAHFDIAGTAWNVANRLNYCPKKGASGSMVRTFVELAQSL